MRSGDFPASLATCRLAISRNLDGENVRLNMLRLGHLTHDAPLIAEQEAWLKEHPDSPLMLFNEGNFAQNEGRMHDAEKLFDQAVAAFARQGASAAGIRVKMGMASS